MKKLLLLIPIFLFGSLAVKAQNFEKQIKSQQNIIRSAYKKKKITELEYNKLMEENQKIQNALDVYNADGTLTQKEKNAIAGKLTRAAKRLNRYKTNGEIY